MAEIAVDIELWLAVADAEILLGLELSLANHARFDALYPEHAA